MFSSSWTNNKKARAGRNIGRDGQAPISLQNQAKNRARSALGKASGPSLCAKVGTLLRKHLRQKLFLGHSSSSPSKLLVFVPTTLLPHVGDTPQGCPSLPSGHSSLCGSSLQTWRLSPHTCTHKGPWRWCVLTLLSLLWFPNTCQTHGH